MVGRGEEPERGMEACAAKAFAGHAAATEGALLRLRFTRAASASTANKVRSSNLRSPVSQRDTVACLTPNFWANSAWVIPRVCSRIVRMLFIGRIYTHTYSLVNP